jgi:LemA protein
MVSFIAFLFVAVSALSIITVWVIGSKLLNRYNSLVQVHENLDKAWADIDVMLKQRNDELTKLLDSVSAFQEHEEEIMEEVTEARQEALQASSPKQEAEADAHLRQSLDRLFAVAEDYPDLKSSENVHQLQERISEIEERIADRRELYNEAVSIHNARIQQIPDVFFAQVLGYSEREMFEAPEEDRQDVDVDAALTSS